MKHFFTALLCLCITATAALAQDVQVTYCSLVSPAGAILQPGHEVEFTVRLQNVGNQTAASSFLDCSFNDNLSASTIQVGRIQVPAIPANAFSDTLHFYYTIPHNFPFFNVKPAVTADATNTVAESNENNNGLVNNGQPFAFLNDPTDHRTLPYPFIFIHGLNSSSEVWNTWLNMLQTSQGWQSGGTFHFCLNGDGNTEIASLSEIQNHTNYSSLHRGDFYCLNFDVNPDGSVFGNNVESNQSAIVKQGIALEQMVNDVLALTEAEKVILVGHSMGGLCSREFIQNYDANADKTKRLTTIFTPHGGSNATGFGLEMFVGLNELGEAIRDLRYDYYDNYPGVYLFGGVECNNLVTNTFFDFDNVDVNCNGVLMDTIVGINEKAIPDASKMDFSCVIGTGSLLGGDAIVDDVRANLNNYLPQVAADTFIIESPDYYVITEVLHTAGPQDPNLFDTFIAALDEAEQSSLAYDILINEAVYGRLDPKSMGSSEYTNGVFTDTDWYRFETTTNAALSIQLDNLTSSNVVLKLVNSNLIEIGQSNAQNNSSTSLVSAVGPGSFFVSITGLANATSYQYPYRLKVNSAADYTSLNENEKLVQYIYPNPASAVIYLKGNGTADHFYLIDPTGKILNEIAGEQLEKGYDVSTLPKGVYFLKSENGKLLKWMK